jgi:Mor family transcriptional regulator
MNTGKRFTERNAKIVNDRQAGATIKELILKYGLKRSSIYLIISENNQGAK